MHIEKAQSSQLDSLSELEAICFPDDPYPRFFFTQAEEIYSETLLVAYEEGNPPIGYILAAPDSAERGKWWILSMAVHPEHRKRGIGKSLMDKLIDTLSDNRASVIYLSVSENNVDALNLYKKYDFEITRKSYDYFGKESDRLILRRNSKTSSTTSLDPNLLMAEADISVTFSSILFAVSAAILALISPRGDAEEFVIPFALVAMAMFASFYAVLFYANTSGSLTRIHENGNIVLPLKYGNSISEYLGVYPLVCAFPILIWHVTESYIITLPVALLNYAGFIFYQASGFDLLSRTIIRKIRHTLSTIFITLLRALHLTGVPPRTVRGKTIETRRVPVCLR